MSTHPLWVLSKSKVPELPVEERSLQSIYKTCSNCRNEEEWSKQLQIACAVLWKRNHYLSLPVDKVLAVALMCVPCELDWLSADESKRLNKEPSPNALSYKLLPEESQFALLRLRCMDTKRADWHSRMYPSATRKRKPDIAVDEAALVVQQLYGSPTTNEQKEWFRVAARCFRQQAAGLSASVTDEWSKCMDYLLSLPMPHIIAFLGPFLCIHASWHPWIFQVAEYCLLQSIGLITDTPFKWRTANSCINVSTDWVCWMYAFNRW